MTTKGDAVGDRRSPVQLLAQVARRIGASLDLEATLHAVANAVLEALDFETAVVNLAIDDGDLQAVVVAGSDEARSALLGHRWKREICEAFFAAADTSGGVYFVPGERMAALQHAHPEVHVYVPAIDAGRDAHTWDPMDALFAAMTGSDGELLGVLSVDMPRDGRRPTLAKRQLLGAFAVHAALAIEHAKMHSRLRGVERELRHQATHDALTGLPNRANVWRQLDWLMLGQDTAPEGVAFAFCDLDAFKEVNDTYGHAVGDAVLVEVARVLRGAVRPTDLVGRFGGDEFVVLCQPIITADEAAAVAERIASATSQAIVVAGHRIVPSLSVGVSIARPGMTADSLMAQADAALYAAKAQGGGRWQVFRVRDDDDTPRFDAAAWEQPLLDGTALH